MASSSDFLVFSDMASSSDVAAKGDVLQVQRNKTSLGMSFSFAAAHQWSPQCPGKQVAEEEQPSSSADVTDGKFTILETKGKYSKVWTSHCQADAETPALEVVWKVCEGTPLLESSKGTFKLLKGKLTGKTFVKLLPQNLLMTVKDDMTWANVKRLPFDDGSSSDSDIDIVEEARFKLPRT